MPNTAYNTRATLEAAIYTWIAGLLTAEGASAPACTIIWANENGIQPVGSYIEMNLVTGGIMEGSTDMTRFNQGVDHDRVFLGNRNATLSINAYGIAASELLWDMKQSLEAEASETLLESLNLSVIEHTDVLDLSELQETKFQRRQQMDIRLGYTTEKISGSGNTEAVEVQDEINDETILIEAP